MIEHDKIGVILLMKGRSILRLYNAARHLADPRYVNAATDLEKSPKNAIFLVAIILRYLGAPCAYVRRWPVNEPDLSDG